MNILIIEHDNLKELVRIFNNCGGMDELENNMYCLQIYKMMVSAIDKSKACCLHFNYVKLNVAGFIY